jgi:Zn-dependent peptidase ImmA (M78 family)
VKTLTKFEKLLCEAEMNGVRVYDFDLGDGDFDGLYVDGNIALSDKMETSVRRACVLAEELGHHYMTVGDILDQNDIGNRKQERKARAWAYEKMIPLSSIKRAIEKGYYETWEIAEYLDVDEKFLREAIKHYEEVDGDELIRWRSK